MTRIRKQKRAGRDWRSLFRCDGCGTVSLSTYEARRQGHGPTVEQAEKWGTRCSCGSATATYAVALA